MENKLLTAQHIFKNAGGQLSAGFNQAIYGDLLDITQPKEVIRGYCKAENMIADGEVYYVHNFHKIECTGHRPSDAFIYGGFWVCTSCGKKSIDKPWWIIKVERDGDSWCCKGENFINLQESDNYAFGTTREEAIRNYGNKYIVKDSHEHTNTNVPGTAE